MVATHTVHLYPQSDSVRRSGRRSVTLGFTLPLLVLVTLQATAEEPTKDIDVDLCSQTLLTLRGEGTGMMIDFGSQRASNSIPALATPAAVDITVPVRGADPRIGPGMMVDIIVMVGGRKEVSEIGKRVSDDGTITLPLVGVVTINDMSMKELSDRLQNLYSTYLRDPQVEADFNVSNAGAVSPWGAVTVLGRVKSPGSIGIPRSRDLTVSRAIQGAGGFDTSANDSSVRISRRRSDGSVKKITVDLHALGSSGELKQDITLEAGDVVFVPEEIF